MQKKVDEEYSEEKQTLGIQLNLNKESERFLSMMSSLYSSDCNLTQHKVMGEEFPER